MNPIDRNKIWKMVGILALITVVAGGLLRVSQHNSYTLGDYASDNPTLAYQTAEPSLSTSPSPAPAVDSSNPQMRQKTCRKDLPWRKLPSLPVFS